MKNKTILKFFLIAALFTNQPVFSVKNQSDNWKEESQKRTNGPLLTAFYQGVKKVPFNLKEESANLIQGIVRRMTEIQGQKNALYSGNKDAEFSTIRDFLIELESTLRQNKNSAENIIPELADKAFFLKEFLNIFATDVKILKEIISSKAETIAYKSISLSEDSIALNCFERIVYDCTSKENTLSSIIESIDDNNNTETSLNQCIKNEIKDNKKDEKLDIDTIKRSVKDDINRLFTSVFDELNPTTSNPQSNHTPNNLKIRRLRTFDGDLEGWAAGLERQHKDNTKRQHNENTKQCTIF